MKIEVASCEGSILIMIMICQLYLFPLGFYLINILFAGWEVRLVKNCDRGLENAAFSSPFLRPRSQFFTIRTSQPAINMYFSFPGWRVHKGHHVKCLVWCSYFTSKRKFENCIAKSALFFILNGIYSPLQ